MDFSQLDFFWETQKLDFYLNDVDNVIVSLKDVESLSLSVTWYIFK